MIIELFRMVIKEKGIDDLERFLDDLAVLKILGV